MTRPDPSPSSTRPATAPACSCGSDRLVVEYHATVRVTLIAGEPHTATYTPPTHPIAVVSCPNCGTRLDLDDTLSGPAHALPLQVARENAQPVVHAIPAVTVRTKRRR